MSPKDANGMANSIDPDQTAPPGQELQEQSDLGVYVVCKGISVRKRRMFTVKYDLLAYK